MKRALMLLVLVWALVGCGGSHGDGGNPWQGEYLGTYDDGNDYGTLHVWIGDNGDISGHWDSLATSDHGNLWGHIDWDGKFTLNSDVDSCYGHGDWIDGIRVLVIDGCDTRGKSRTKLPFSNLKQNAPKKTASVPNQEGDIIGS